MVITPICQDLSEQRWVLFYGTAKVAPLWRAGCTCVPWKLFGESMMTVMIENTFWLRDGERDQTKHHNYREALMPRRCNPGNKTGDAQPALR